MAEYIERETLLKDIEEERPENWTDSEAERQAESDFYKYRGIVEIQPTADVAEVVRCKDCAFGRTDDEFGFVMCFCRNAPWDNKFVDYFTMSPFDFCSYGKRKEV